MAVVHMPACVCYAAPYFLTIPGILTVASLVAMPVRRTVKLATDYALPPNTTVLHFPRTDGDSTLWPANQELVEDDNGNIHFYQPISANEGFSLKWLHLVG